MKIIHLIIFMMLIVLLGIHTSFAADAIEPWDANWISIADSDSSLVGASWIWMSQEGINPLQNAPAGVCFFRRALELSGNAPVTAATAFFAADNHFNLFVNGKKAGKGDSWDKPVKINIAPFLVAGRNIIAVQAENDSATGSINAAGLIGKLTILRVNQTPIIYVTDAAWKSAAVETEGWTLSTFNDKTWMSVVKLGAAGIPPWTAMDKNTAQNIWTCFRKSFTLDKIPSSAMARIAVDSKYWLWVNGKVVVYEGGLKRGPNPNDTYFDCVELSGHLRKGTNTLAVLAWYWEKDSFSHKSSGKAGFVAKLNIDGRRISTDASWKALGHPAYGTTGDPHPNFRLPGDNIHFDARCDLGEWTSPDFNDTSWPSAKVHGKPPITPWNRLIERPIPLWRFGTLSEYTNASELPRVSDGKPIIARLPRNLTISPYLKIKAPAGLTIDIRTDNYNGGSEYNYRSEYVTREGIQEFESLAYLNGHWTIYSIPAGVEILDLCYRETRYDTDFTGRFECDDPFLNTLWMKCRNTMNVNMRDAIQDPDRERAQWWGDAAIVSGEILHSCDTRSHALIRKAILNLVGWQKADGVLYSPVPAGSWDKELPGQMLASIGRHGFWYYYLYTADKATIAHAYPAVKRYLSLWKLGSDGLVIHRAGGWDWGDWGDNIDRPVMDNALLYQALDAAIEMARLTGNKADIPGYQNMMTRIETNYNRLLWTGSEYRSPGYQGKTDDRGHGLAVLYGLAKPEQWPAIKQVFTQSFEASPYMEKYILESLFCMGDTDAALARMKSRYRKMVDSELSTLWEGWGIGSEGYGGGSYNHGWSGGPLTLLVEYVAGIAPTAPGFAAYQVMPQMGPLKYVRTTVPTVKGNIEVELRRTLDQFTLNLTSPAGTKASVGLPIKGDIRVNDQSVAMVAGIQSRGLRGDYQVFEVEAGCWKFQINQTNP